MELEIDPDEEEKDDINIDNERERHWRNVFEDNEGGVDEKALLHAQRWDLYLNEKEKLVTRSPSHRAKIDGQGEQDRGGDSSQGENWGVRGLGKGRQCKKDE